MNQTKKKNKVLNKKNNIIKKSVKGTVGDSKILLLSPPQRSQYNALKLEWSA